MKLKIKRSAFFTAVLICIALQLGSTGVNGAYRGGPRTVIGVYSPPRVDSNNDIAVQAFTNRPITVYIKYQIQDSDGVWSDEKTLFTHSGPGSKTVIINAGDNLQMNFRAYYGSGGSVRDSDSTIINQKYALFMWDDEAITDTMVNYQYIESLTTADSSYTILKKRRPNDWKAEIDKLDAMEDKNDKVLIFIGGHGGYIPPIGDIKSQSFVTIKPAPFFRLLQSPSLRDKLRCLESERVLVIVQSCRSGKFHEHLKNEAGVTVVVACGSSEVAYPIFARTFFEKFAGTSFNQKHIETAFEETKTKCLNYEIYGKDKSFHPQIDYGAINFDYIL